MPNGGEVEIPSFTAAASAVVGDTDLLNSKFYRTANVDRLITAYGIFVATLAQVDRFVMKVGSEIVVDSDAQDGTAIDPSKLHEGVDILVPAGSIITATVTVDTATTVCQLVLNIEDLE